MANFDHVELEEVVINVDPIKSLRDLVEEGRKRGSQLQPSICMVHRIYRDQNPNCFDPQVVSIGPIHRGHKNVQEHEGLKGAYMNDLLDRLNSPPEQILQTCHMRFKPNRDGNWALAMEYESSALLWPFRSALRLPIWTIEDNTELVLRNLIAYEHSYPDVNSPYFTSFVYAMDMLVDSTEDVTKLVESEVILNFLGSNEIAANMINNIGNEVFRHNVHL